MTSTLLWTLILVQIAMGAFDTVYHHELTERLAWRPTQRRELALHAVRNLLYAMLFLVFGWFEPRGAWAALVIAVLVIEVVVTLMDFLEEDSSRKLPGSERINHTLLAINYGAILALLLPVLLGWAAQDTLLAPVNHGALSAVATVAAVGVVLSGARDVYTSRRTRRLVPARPDGLVRSLAPRQHLLVTGATGFIGRRLVEALTAAGHDVTVLTRDAHKTEMCGHHSGSSPRLTRLRAMRRSTGSSTLLASQLPMDYGPARGGAASCDRAFASPATWCG